MHELEAYMENVKQEKQEVKATILLCFIRWKHKNLIT